MELENKVPEQVNDIKKENLEKLAQLFPSIIKDGQVDFKALKEELGDIEEVKEERYEFTWAGKQNAKKKVQEDVGARTLNYIEKDSKNPDTTENLYIEGDNLEILKLLRQNYYGSIKMIYIDPPYNTGKDFVYKDNFSQDGIKSDILEGSRDKEGNRLEQNTKSSNRYHANWLNMIYPRLKVARDLLTDDGVIFISIDDNEQENLKKICNEIFGEENFIGEIIRENIKGGSIVKHIRSVHDYIFVYGKNEEFLKLSGIDKEAIILNLEDEKGKYKKGRELNKWGAGSRREDSPSMYFPIKGPNNEDIFPIRNDGSEGRWRLGKEKMQSLVKNNDVIFEKRENGTYIVYEKIRDESLKETQYTSLFKDKYVNSKGAELLKKLFVQERAIFDYSKPLELLLDLLIMGTKVYKNSIILDFFSGSATTAHAVMQLNAEDGGNRKFIMVQLPEEVDEKSEAYKFLKENNKPTNICEIGKERIRRAGEKIKEEIEESNKQLKLGEEPKKVPDIGFKVFRTADTNINWKKIREVSQDNVLRFDNPDMLDFIPSFKDKDIVYEVLLRQRDLPLSEKLETLTDIGNRTYLYADSYLVCLETKITEELIEKLAALNPLPIKFIFRDSAFGSEIGLKEETFRYLKTLVEKNSGLTKKAYTVEFI